MHSRAIMIAALAAGTCACSGSGYYLIKSGSSLSLEDDKPEIVQTPTYKVRSSGIRSIAVRAPDSCANRTADMSSGAAISRETIMRTACGVEMARIERGLTMQQYTVISWSILDREMKAMMSQGREQSPIEVAARLGAEVLLQVNSLEKSLKPPAGRERKDRFFYMSNREGEQLEPQAVEEKTWKYLVEQFFKPLEADKAFWPPAVTVDATAVMVKTGESIWYYRWTHMEVGDASRDPKTLLSCKKDFRVCVDISARQRRAQDLVNQQQGKRSDEKIERAIQEQQADANEATYSKLLDVVIDDMITRFRRAT